jgi:hypothetical protein
MNVQYNYTSGLTSAACGNRTDCIATKLEEDCFQPPQVQLLGLQ